MKQLGTYRLERRDCGHPDPTSEGSERIKLKFLSKIRYGLGQPPRQKDDGLPFIRATNIERGKINPVGLVFVDPEDVPSTRDAVLEKDDIIVVRSGAYTGDSAIIPPDYEGAIAGYDIVVRVTKAVPKFIAYGLLSAAVLNDQIDMCRLRAAQPHLNVEELGECVFVVPPNSKQQIIVEFLDRKTAQIDALIGKKQRQIELLQEKRQALINQAVTSGFDSGVPTKDSSFNWLGKIPESWRMLKLLLLLCDRPKNGISPPPPVDGNGLLTFSIAAVRDGVVRINEHIKHTDLESEGNRDYLVESGDIFVVRGNANQGLVGTCGRVGVHPPGCVYPDLLIRIRPNQLIEPDYLVFAINSMVGRRQMEMLARTSNGTLKISGEDLASIRILLPPREEQREILRVLAARLTQTERLSGLISSQLNRLREYRQALITAAVTGKLDIQAEAAP